MSQSPARRPVFPLKPNEKTPVQPNFKALATTDHATIAGWWHQNHYNLGYVPATGGETVIDLDVHNRKDGGWELKKLMDSLGKKLPDTLTVRTPSGGAHLYFKGLAPYDKINFLPGVDVMCHKRYVVLPPSVTKDGKYEVTDNIPPAELPQWFIDEMLRRKGGAAGSPKPETKPINLTVDADTPDKIAAAVEIIRNWPEAVEGQRNDQLFQLACELCKAGVSEGKARELYAEHGMDRIHLEADATEVLNTIHSAYEEREGEFGSTSHQALIARFDKVGDTEADAEDWSDMEAADVPDRKWFIKDWLLYEPGTILLFSGQGGTGKSLLGLMLAYCLATGEDWLGMKVERRAKSFIVSCEDSRDEQARRVQRVKKLYGHGLGHGLVKVWCRAGENNVLATATREGIIVESGFLKTLKQKCEDHFHGDGGIVILDTLSDFVAINENDRMQVSQFVKHTLAKFAQDVGATVILLAHPNKTNAGYSGSTAWEAAARSRWELAWVPQKDGELTLTLGKANSTMRGKQILLRYGEDYLPHVTSKTEKNTELEDLIVKMIGDAAAEGNPFGRGRRSKRPIVSAEIIDPSTGVMLEPGEIDNRIGALLASGRIVLPHTKEGNVLLLKKDAPIPLSSPSTK